MDAAMAKLFHRLGQLSVLATIVEDSVEDRRLQLFKVRMMLFERQVNASVWSVGLHNIRQYGSANRLKASAAVRALRKDVAYNDPSYFISGIAQNISRVSSFGEAGCQIQDFVAKLDERGNAEPLRTKATYVGFIYCWHYSSRCGSSVAR